MAVERKVSTTCGASIHLLQFLPSWPDHPPCLSSVDEHFETRPGLGLVVEQDLTSSGTAFASFCRGSWRRSFATGLSFCILPISQASRLHARTPHKQHKHTGAAMQYFTGTRILETINFTIFAVGVHTEGKSQGRPSQKNHISRRSARHVGLQRTYYLK